MTTERPTAAETAEAIAELANEVELTRGLNVYVELTGEVAGVLLAALRCAAEDAEKMREIDTLDAAVGLHEGVELIYVVDGYEASLTTHDGATVKASAWGETIMDALVALGRTLLGGT